MMAMCGNLGESEPTAENQRQRHTVLRSTTHGQHPTKFQLMGYPVSLYSSDDCVYRHNVGSYRVDHVINR